MFIYFLDFFVCCLNNSSHLALKTYVFFCKLAKWLILVSACPTTLNVISPYALYTPWTVIYVTDTTLLWGGRGKVAEKGTFSLLLWLCCSQSYSLCFQRNLNFSLFCCLIHAHYLQDLCPWIFFHITYFCSPKVTPMPNSIPVQILKPDLLILSWWQTFLICFSLSIPYYLEDIIFYKMLGTKSSNPFQSFSNAFFLFFIVCHSMKCIVYMQHTSSAAIKNTAGSFVPTYHCFHTHFKLLSEFYLGLLIISYHFKANEGLILLSWDFLIIAIK